MVEGNYTRAIKLFETLEARFPYGRYAQQAILELAYANYRAGETAAAVAACDRFIRTYPEPSERRLRVLPKGLVHFREDQGLLGYVYELDLSEREPKGMRESFAAFKELVAKFPDSRYAQDATDRMVYLTNALAMYEVKVARYYYNRGAYVAAVNRAQAAIVNYPRTPANESALDVLAQELRQARARAAARRLAAHPAARRSPTASISPGPSTSRGGSSGRRGTPGVSHRRCASRWHLGPIAASAALP